MIRYNDCIREQSDCANCSLTNYGKDCRNNPVNKLAYLRTKKGLSQIELCKLTEISKTNMSGFENGQRSLESLSGGALRKLAAALNCTIEELFND